MLANNTSTNFQRQPKYTSNKRILNLNLPSLYVSVYKNMVTCIRTQNVPILLIHLSNGKTCFLTTFSIDYSKSMCTVRCRAYKQL